MSLKKIAELTGTSVSTVSRVLNQPGHTCHDPRLSDQIWETAAALNYLPNSAARNLRMGLQEEKRHFTVDIFLTRFDTMDQDPFFRELFQHIKKELLEHNCHMGELQTLTDITKLSTLSSVSDKIPFRSASRSHSEKSVHSPALITPKQDTGLIVLGRCPSKLVPLLKKRYPFLIGIDRNPTNFEYDEIICDGVAAAEKAVEYLISLGHRDIAYIGNCSFESRYIGYYQSLLNHKIPLDYDNIHPSSQTMEEGERIMETILRSSHLPSALFCANDCTALGVLEALKKHKKRRYLPSIISIDNINDSQKTTPLLTTIDIPKKEMAHLAVTLLVDRRNEARDENIRIELPSRLIVRESCTWH